MVMSVGSCTSEHSLEHALSAFHQNLSHGAARKDSVAPFMTHEGSAMGRAVGDIKKICRDSKVLAALPIRGGSVKKSEKTVENWLRQQGAI